MSDRYWVPEIMYEGESELEGSLTSNIPFIPVPESEEMPKILFIFESRETGETEPGPQGEELAVTEMDLHQYADMSVLKENLDAELYDTVRKALDLEPLRDATLKGADLTYKIREKASTGK